MRARHALGRPAAQLLAHPVHLPRRHAELGRERVRPPAPPGRAHPAERPDALEQLRWALATGVSPVLISSALAQGVRALGRVGAAGRGRGADALAAELGLPPWKVDRVRQQLRGWTAEGVARAHAVVAQADAQVKGEGASPGYALERAITEIVACRSPQ